MQQQKVERKAQVYFFECILEKVVDESGTIGVICREAW